MEKERQVLATLFPQRPGSLDMDTRRRSGDVRALLRFESVELRGDLLAVMGIHWGLRPPGAVKKGIPIRVGAALVFEEQQTLGGQRVHWQWPLFTPLACDPLRFPLSPWP